MSFQQPAERRLRQPSSSTVIIAGAVLAILAMVAVIAIGRQHSRDTAASPTAPWLVPWQPPIPLLSNPPAPSPSAAAVATADRQPVSRRPVNRQPAGRTSPAPGPSRTTARLLPGPGAGVSLLAAGSTGLRLRHQDFRMRLATIGPDSTRLARADASFIVHRGLADARCISLESVNYPGWFMRHEKFVLRLQAQQSSPGYRADATFCPQAVGPDADFRLRSVNFPDHFLTVRDAQVFLGPVAATAAQRFHAAPALAPGPGAQE
jgi:hypothetical protein